MSPNFDIHITVRHSVRARNFDQRSEAKPDINYANALAKRLAARRPPLIKLSVSQTIDILNTCQMVESVVLG